VRRSRVEAVTSERSSHCFTERLYLILGTSTVDIRVCHMMFV
jgi:hypothetical protein